MVYVVAGVPFLLFVFLVVLAAKNWRALHIVCLVLVFLAALPAVMMMAAQHKNRQVWRKKIEALEKQVADAEKQQKLLEIGALNEVTQSNDSVKKLRAELAQTLLYRGRVWRACTPGGAQGNAVTVNVSRPGPDGAAPTPHTLKAGTILYVFRERDDAPTGGKAPDLYLGEFAVTNATDTAVTLTDTLPLDNVQRQEAGRQGATWALYEVMPFDRHNVWTNDQPDEQHLFGTPVPEKLAAIPPKARPDFERDGMTAQPSDPPERIWVKLEFLQKHEVKVDSDDDPANFTNREFDPFGRASLAALRQGAVTTFNPGDNAYFDSATANQLITDGIAKKSDSPKTKPVGPTGDIFVRELRSYDQHFHRIFRRDDVLSSSIRTVKRNSAAVEESRKSADKQVAYRVQEKQKLEVDLAGLKRERDEVARYRDALTAKIASLRSQLSQVYRENVQLSNELTRMHNSVRDAVDRASGQASRATVPGEAASVTVR